MTEPETQRVGEWEKEKARESSSWQGPQAQCMPGESEEQKGIVTGNWSEMRSERCKGERQVGGLNFLLCEKGVVGIG